MLIAFHPQGASLSAYAMRQWINAAKADINAAPGVIIRVKDPRHPYFFGPTTLADDKTSIAGKLFSRVIATPRRGRMEFQLVGPEIAEVWRQWFAATQGGRIPFVIVEPLSGERVAVQSPITSTCQRESYNRYQPTALELTEWL